MLTCMQDIIQVRNVPPETRRHLDAAARERGISLAAYVRELLDRDAQRARNRALVTEIANTSEPAPDLGDLMLDLLREERER